MLSLAESKRLRADRVLVWWWGLWLFSTVRFARALSLFAGVEQRRDQRLFGTLGVQAS